MLPSLLSCALSLDVCIIRQYCIFSPYAQVRMHALEGVACRARIILASSHASPCSGEVPACHACGSTSPFCTPLYSMSSRARIGGIMTSSSYIFHLVTFQPCIRVQEAISSEAHQSKVQSQRTAVLAHAVCNSRCAQWC